MAMLDSTVANLALESIRADFSATLPLVQWVVTGYLIALAVSLPLVAWLGGRFGQGRLWAAGLAGFVLASALCALAPGPLWLIGARVLQGLAGGLMVPAGQAVIGASVERRQFGRIMGTLGLVVALGPAIGPAIGGLLLDVASWRWLFWINVPIGIAALAFGYGRVPGGARDAGRAFDAAGFLLLGSGLPLVLYGAGEIAAGVLRASGLGALSCGVLLIAVFARRTLRRAAPLIELRLLRRPAFAAAAATAGLTGANMYGGLLLVPLYLQNVAALGAADTGFLLLAMGLGSALVLPLAGALTDRLGAGAVCLAGAGLLLVATLPFAGPDVLPAWLLAPLLVLRGIGMALGQMPAMTAAYAAARADEMGDAASLVNIVQRIGGAGGAVLVVAVLAQAGAGAAGHRFAFLALAVLSCATLVTGLALRRAARAEH